MGKNLKTHTFLGKRYIVAYGQCDSPNTHNKAITVPTTGKTLFDLSTVIHESLHACDYEASENKVEETSDLIAEILWKQNFRKDSENGAGNPDEIRKILEEVLSAIEWSRELEIIYQTSYDIARFLSRIGWRKQDGKTEGSNRRNCS